jgi:hypothetical protein
MSVHGALQARMTRQRRLHASRRSIPHFMLAFVSGVRHVCSKRARSRPTRGVPVPFSSAQPSHGCVRDTDQLVYIHRIGITDAAAQKNLPSIHTIPLCRALSSEHLHAYHKPPCRAVAEDRRTSRRSPESRQCMGWIEPTWIHQKHQPRPALTSPSWHHRRCRDSHLYAP